MHLQSALFTPPARITASVPQFVLYIRMRFPEHLDFQFLLFYFLSLSVDFAPRVLLTESFVIFYTLITELKSEIRTSSYETLTGSLPWRSFGTTDLSRWAQFKTADLLRDEEETNVSMKMTNREVGGVSVVALDGRIVLGDESNALRVKLKSLIAEGKNVWLLKLVRRFEEDPGEVRRLQAYGDPTLEQLNRAKEYTQRMRDRGELRSPRQRVPAAIEPAMEQFVRERFAQGWSRSRLARGFDLDRRTVKRILQK